MKTLFAMILLLLVIGLSSGIAFADVSVPKKIYQNQELLITITNAKSKYVTAVFYDLPMKNPETKYAEVSSRGFAALSHPTKTLTFPSPYNLGPPHYDSAIKTVVYVDGEKLEFLTKIIRSIG